MKKSSSIAPIRKNAFAAIIHAVSWLGWGFAVFVAALTIGCAAIPPDVEESAQVENFSTVGMTATEAEMVQMAAEKVCQETSGECCPTICNGPNTIEIGASAVVTPTRIVLPDTRTDFDHNGLTWHAAQDAFRLHCQVAP